jgi:hypothetical protein
MDRGDPGQHPDDGKGRLEEEVVSLAHLTVRLDLLEVLPQRLADLREPVPANSDMPASPARPLEQADRCWAPSGLRANLSSPSALEKNSEHCDCLAHRRLSRTIA